MMYHLGFFESLEIQVELPMLLEIDNSGTVELANNWSVGGRTIYIEKRHN